jgi:intracellular sulfur oxidation DsrE/DsrF family protein
MFMRVQSNKLFLAIVALLPALALFMSPIQLQAADSSNNGKVKVIYHVNGKDPEVAKYALALINKHIEAEGGPDKIDVELIVHGPALELFEKDNMDAEMTKRFDQIIAKGVKAEMCQVSMKFFGKTIDNLARICRHVASGRGEADRGPATAGLPAHQAVKGGLSCGRSGSAC